MASHPNQPGPRRLSRRGRVVALALMTTLALAASAFAAPATINDVDLTAGGGATYEPYNDDFGCTDGTSGSTGGFYSSVEDGDLSGASDAFDAGLVLYVGDDGFRDGDGTGDLSGQQLTVGPRKVDGVQVTRIDRALPGSRTLRSLIKLKNPTRRTMTRYVSLDTEYGSDSETVVETTSSGNNRFNSKDRWGITSDDAPFSDPVVTLVNYGKGRVLKPVLQIGPYAAKGGNDGADCVLDVFLVRLPPRATRYLLFYVEMSADDTAAENSVRKFNRQRLTAALLKGIKSGVRSKILNWDLT